VQTLRRRGDLDASLPAMRAVGYRQAWTALDADHLDELAATATAATRQLAKRQLTWLRALPWREVVACDAPDASDRVVAIATRWLAEGRLG
jgi:tRNA dimethylallyltransferase